MVTGYLPSRKVILGVTAILLVLSGLLYTGILQVPQISPRLSPLLHPQQEQQQQQLTDVKNTQTVTKPRTTVPVVKEEPPAVEEKPQIDVVDNNGAIKYLKQYSHLFNQGQLASDTNPNNPSSIKQWWQAAAMIDWYINSPIRHKCQNRVAMGNWHICQDEPYVVKPPCLTYSFGINFDFSFDDAMGRLGCEVHSFDPSMKKDDHQRSQNVTFHNLGLGNFNSDVFDPRQDIYVHDDQKWKMRTLKAVTEMLKHENRVIDVLKIDVEGHEWAVVENLFETGMFPHVRQFMLEWHLFPSWPVKEEYVHLYKVYTKLRDMGFREFSIGPHPKTLKVGSFNNQGDSEYVNIFFKRKPSWT